jgi:hypothetical protein
MLHCPEALDSQQSGYFMTLIQMYLSRNMA